jgi:hypothetical protein
MEFGKGSISILTKRIRTEFGSRGILLYYVEEGYGGAVSDEKILEGLIFGEGALHESKHD